MPDYRFSRRRFFFGVLLAGAVPAGGFGRVPSLNKLGYKSPNEKLGLAAVGCGGQPFLDLSAAEAGVENVVALADVDWKRGAQGFAQWPKASRYRDFRKMLDRHGKEIDAVVIGTPDHTHACCALACMQLGKHVYVEKPLTRTAWEARLLRDAAAKYKVATQMGNQGYSHDATRVACEILWSGEIGEVTEVHSWMGSAIWPQGMKKMPPPAPVPETLDWDLWLGGAEWREYTEGDEDYRSYAASRVVPGAFRFPGQDEFRFYLPFNWRGFYDFGSSLIGDWGIHALGPANWALQLSPEHLVSVECTRKGPLPPFTYPDELTLKYEFSARPGMPPVTVYWHHHPDGDAYLPPGMKVEEARKIEGTGPQVGPANEQAKFFLGGKGSGYNCIFVGSKGYLGTGARGEIIGLLPRSRWADYKLPAPYLTRSPGASTGSNHAAHCRDWIRACKGGAPACSEFSISAPFTEWMVLGAAAIHADGRLMWDNAKCEFTNNKDVNKWVKPTYRKGWELSL